MKDLRRIGVYLVSFICLVGCGGGAAPSSNTPLASPKTSETASVPLETVSPDLSSDEAITEPNTEANGTEELQQIEATAYITDTAEVLVLLTNTTGSELGEVKVTVDMYKEGELIHSADDKLYQILPDADLVFEVFKPQDENNNWIQPDNVEVNVKTEPDKGLFKNIQESFDVEFTDGAQKVIIKATYKGEEAKASIKYSVVFYKDDVPVASEFAIEIVTVKPGDTVTLTCSHPRSLFPTKADINYDRIEVLPTGVHIL